MKGNNLPLYLIPFLHQTTTLLLVLLHRCCCILFHFYIKPQLGADHIRNANCCILFHFYIKPQPLTWRNLSALCCILFHFYIKPQQEADQCQSDCVVSYSISTSNHNCDTALLTEGELYLIPFLHQTTTATMLSTPKMKLYLIPFLHQTTTL